VTTLRGDVAPPDVFDGDQRTGLVLVHEASDRRWVLSRSFERSGPFVVVAEAADTFSGLVAVREHDPDVLVVDLDLGASAVEVVRLAVSTFPFLAVVALGRWAEPDLIEQALRCGAVGVVSRAAEPAEIVGQVAALLARAGLPTSEPA